MVLCCRSDGERQRLHESANDTERRSYTGKEDPFLDDGGTLSRTAKDNRSTTTHKKEKPTSKQTPTQLDCGADNVINPREPIRCKECGHRILYKKRTKRSASFLLFSDLYLC
ncbi:hypothetical protein BDR26DRAFT_798126 [Obelidium mucronatum]|nr:hypothetical protein BDR26DRAFT_798126 [Obelidium mucronatum]